MAKNDGARLATTPYILFIDADVRFFKYNVIRDAVDKIDIIAKKNNLLVIVEVKTRTSSFFERPQDAVTIKKQKHLISATNEYVSLKNFSGEIQFDIISVLLENNKEIIEHIEDAFYPLV
jgi:putative endonuclease